MNTVQVTATCQPGIYVKNVSQLHQLHSKPYVLPMSINTCSRIPMSGRAKPSSGLECRPISKSRKPLHICLAGGKGMMSNDDEISPWKAMEKAMEKFKGQPIEDVLREQIGKGEYYDNGGRGAKPPGGGSGGGGGPDGPGGPEDENFAETFDENLQVALATLGFIFLYIYILTGEEFTKLARDYIKYVFGGSQSVRLKSAMSKWEQFSEMTETEEDDEYWLEEAIMDTPTWWYNPDDYYTAVNNYLKSNPDESDSDF
ncbi:uncharacterized protein LOC133286356 [Gastrolobium bilobum]|uniref:uncharacterized protein LOC133286356 n=1 Tax=Gastrolobium bilobum TaxID=150636 RepID=UPI002AB1FF92|nr:uncharacterized protein LOC133286356 [Gastrolobium bilobum]XP_061339744.1 uncharacterized protein LOC133286356 [Gastrolobium bilobum]XP_061339745.1 uncharacterized protein LOC133286356 [Gastrolobium bilobum]